MTHITLRIAGLCFGVHSDLNLDFGDHCVPFLCEQSTVDFSYQIVPTPCPVCGDVVFSTDMYTVYHSGKTEYRQFPIQNGSFVLKTDDDQPTCATLYGDRESLVQYGPSIIRDFLALEVALLKKHTFILHSSLVRVNGCAVVFSGPSGIGKSTQAELWEQYKQAEVLNGDRTCVQLLPDRTVGHGSFFAGTSHIYRQDSAPIQAILFLEQGEENELTRLPYGTAFSRLYSQVLHNPWDVAYTEKLIDVLRQTVLRVPVYHFRCRADASAVDAVYDLLFNTRLR